MIVTKEDFVRYKQAQAKTYSPLSIDSANKPLSRKRQLDSGLDVELFIYIYDNYDRLEEQFSKK